MADTYDVIIVGAGSGGGFLAGEIAPHCSLLILDAGPHLKGDPNFGFGSPERRKFSTQINLGTYFPNSADSIRGSAFFAYQMYMDESSPGSVAVQREARLVGGGSAINVGAWVRPRLVDFDGYAEETGVEGWTKSVFERHFRKAERILHVHRDRRENWNKASVLYERTALSMGIPVFETASNRHRCIFCGHRLNAGMPCKYDALMSTAITQIPKALTAGATLLDNALTKRVIVRDKKAIGIEYVRNGETFQAMASKLVVLAAGAMGTPLIMRSSELHLLNGNVGKYLRAHPGIPIDALMPTDDWDTDRGYQWNCYHYTMDDKGQPMDAIVHISAGFPANTPWVASAVGTFGRPYKDLMRRFRQRTGAFIFQLKPNMYGRVAGEVDNPVIMYQVADKSGKLEPKTLSDLVASVRQVASVYKQMGAITTYPNGDDPDFILERGLSNFVTSSGALHPQSTCRAGKSPQNSVVDTNCMSWDTENLMVCDASVIPHHISANPNAQIMAIANRASEYVITQILGKTVPPEEADPVEAAGVHDHPHSHGAAEAL